jgi:hypothetical protein
MRKRCPTLAALFAALNASHFGGRLHGYRVVRSKTNRRRFITRPGVSGVQGGYCKPVRRLIAVWERLEGTLARRALLHEMCHAVTAEEIFDGFSHGLRWRTEMLRLADALGERWAATEARVYAAEADSASEAAYLDSQQRNEAQLREWAQQMRARLRTVTPLAAQRPRTCSKHVAGDVRRAGDDRRRVRGPSEGPPKRRRATTRSPWRP